MWIWISKDDEIAHCKILPIKIFVTTLENSFLSVIETYLDPVFVCKTQYDISKSSFGRKTLSFTPTIWHISLRSTSFWKQFKKNILGSETSTFSVSSGLLKNIMSQKFLMTGLEYEVTFYICIYVTRPHTTLATIAYEKGFQISSCIFLRKSATCVNFIQS